MNVYPFIEAEKAEQDGNVATACVLLKVSRSAYYELVQAHPLGPGSLRRRPRRQDRRHSHQEPRDLWGAPDHHQAGPGGHLRRAKTGGPSHGASWSHRALQAPVQGDDDPRP